MYRLLLSFKKMFADDYVFESIGAAVKQGIERDIVPFLQNNKKPGTVELIAEYRELTKSKWINTFSEKVIRGAAWKNHVIDNDTIINDVAEKVVGDLIESPRSSGVFRKFNPFSGVEKFTHYMTKVISLDAHYRIREIINKKEVPSGVDLRNRDWDVPVEEKADFEEFVSDMIEYFYANVGRIEREKYKVVLSIEIFDIYKKELEEDHGFDMGIESVMSKWLSMRNKKGLPATRTSFYEGSKVVKNVIKQFFIENNKYKRMSGKTVADRVVRAEFRRRISKWVLGK